MSVSVTLKSYFYEVLIPSSQKNTSSPIEDILHHVSKYIFYEKACALQMFQSTHPHGVRQETKQFLCLLPKFQSTHPHGVRPGRYFIGLLHPGFNPRTHTGCDPGAEAKGYRVDNVSIHAPTRGAILAYMITWMSLRVSIHAPTRGAIHCSARKSSARHCFNPRTHTGCDVGAISGR